MNKESISRSYGLECLRHGLIELAVEENEIIETLNNEHDEEIPDLDGDRANIVLLTFLYFMQGVVSGLSSAMSLLLQKAKVFMQITAEQATFSLKLLWAPIIDSLYSKKCGTRRSWLIPTQYLIGIFMLILSRYVDLWLTGDGQKPNIQMLTILYFGLNFLAASQDITTDGWAVEMVKKCNTGYIATCNQIGQKSGFFIGFAVFTAFESVKFCNKYLRTVPQTTGFITLSGFLFCWGICFLCATTLIAFLKRKRMNERISSVYSKFNLINSYKVLYHILKIPATKQLKFIPLTSKFAYAVCDNVAKLKLLDVGVPKDNLLILIMLSMIPTEIILPLIVTTYTTGSKPTEIYIGLIPFRTAFSVTIAFIVWQTPLMIDKSGVPSLYRLFLILLNIKMMF